MFSNPLTKPHFINNGNVKKNTLATTTNATNCGTHKVQGKHKIAWQDEAQKTSKTSRKYMQAVHASIYTNN